ncbi:MAG: NYN domain-containing protein [Alkalimonas sp.]|nr:NYN domain-containing protein [Alkalimonas sp.]
MKTRVYVDGYNLYYGCLKNTPYKWLDLVKLFEAQLLPQSAPQALLPTEVSVKYFTADIKEQAAFDDTSLADQNAYHRALEASYPNEKLEIVKGYFSIADEYAFEIDPEVPDKYPKDCRKIQVWKLEEKQTDVNIAIHALYDVLSDQTLEQIVFVTNDTDLAPVLKMIAEIKRVKIGLIVPIKEKNLRRASTMLTDNAHWVRTAIDQEALKSSSLPRVISSSVRQTKLRKTIIKPNSWFGETRTLEQILDTLGEVLKSPSEKWQWLEAPKPEVKGLPVLKSLPCELLDDENTALDVLVHAKCYADYIKKKSK